MAKGNLQAAINYAENAVKNHGIYVWGAQGQKEPRINEAWIKKKETSITNANRAINFWKKQRNAGYGSVLEADDCSGLICQCLLAAGSVTTDFDDTANGLLNQCTSISRSELKKGCFVGRRSGTNTYHIGLVVDDNGAVIEAMGRDNGIVKRNINASGSSYWNRYGRPDRWFDFGKEPQPTPDPKPAIDWELSRLLKNTSPYMKGNDVHNAQLALITRRFSCGSTGADGVFGMGTRNAVVAFQKSIGLASDGVIGQKTCEALGGKWVANVTTFTLDRLLKLKSPHMKGNDVKAVQKELLRRNYSVGNMGVDGAYGDATKKAVINFQKAVGLAADGIVGEKTCQALNGVHSWW